MAGLHLDPVVSLINQGSKWAWYQVANMAGTWMAHMVFRPLSWPPAVIQLYVWSRDLAWSLVGIVMVLAVIRSMWPELSFRGSRLSIPLFLERLAAASLMGLAGVWAVSAGLVVNNNMVASLLSGNPVFHPAAAPSGVLSPLVVLVVSLAMLALMLYLALFYAVRAIELYVLTAAIPWFALWWAVRDDDVVLSTLGKELAVVIFVQTVHAGAFWLALHLFSLSNSGAAGVFMELALLWYMTKLPGQLRRLTGSTGGVIRLWR